MRTPLEKPWHGAGENGKRKEERGEGIEGRGNRGEIERGGSRKWGNGRYVSEC